MSFITKSDPRIENVATQSVEYIEMGQLSLGALPEHQHRVRLIIHSNAYDFQSWARAERWDGDKWQEVVTIHGAAMTTGKNGSLYVKRDVELGRHLFVVDRQRLVELASEVLTPTIFDSGPRNRVKRGPIPGDDRLD